MENAPEILAEGSSVPGVPATLSTETKTLPVKLSLPQFLALAAGVLLSVIATQFVWIELGGFFGFACFLGIMTLIVGLMGCWVSPHVPQRKRLMALTIGIVLGVTVGRLIWQGNGFLIGGGFLLLGILSDAIHGYITRWWCFFLRIVFAPFEGLANTNLLPRALSMSSPESSQALSSKGFTWGIPIIVGMIFAIPLIASHPDISESIWESIQLGVNRVWNSVSLPKMAWNVIVGLMTAGLLLPRFRFLHATEAPPPRDSKFQLTHLDRFASMSRNLLSVVIVVFALFLVLEFQSLWTKEFPKGFYYSGYAHQGAAWLTLTLAMSTGLFIVLFPVQLRSHSRARTLKYLALAFFALNLLLALAVYHRMNIYVNYNGLTRMRIVGYVGVSCVVIGFVLVLARVLAGKAWYWLVTRQIWTFLACLYLLALLPMDVMAHRWNLAQWKRGYEPPAVQLTHHPLSDEGLLVAMELLDQQDEQSRNWFMATLAQRALDSGRVKWKPDSDQELAGTPRLMDDSWGEYQGSTSLLEQAIKPHWDEILPFLKSSEERDRAIRQWKNWTYQWY
jgi:hypothetical protein